MENKNIISSQEENKNTNILKTDHSLVDNQDGETITQAENLDILQTPKIEVIEEFYDSHGNITRNDQILSVFRNFISTKEKIKEGNRTRIIYRVKTYLLVRAISMVATTFLLVVLLGYWMFSAASEENYSVGRMGVRMGENVIGFIEMVRSGLSNASFQSKETSISDITDTIVSHTGVINYTGETSVFSSGNSSITQTGIIISSNVIEKNTQAMINSGARIVVRKRAYVDPNDTNTIKQTYTGIINKTEVIVSSQNQNGSVIYVNGENTIKEEIPVRYVYTGVTDSGKTIETEIVGEVYSSDPVNTGSTELPSTSDYRALHTKDIAEVNVKFQAVSDMLYDVLARLVRLENLAIGAEKVITTTEKQFVSTEQINNWNSLLDRVNTLSDKFNNVLTSIPKDSVNSATIVNGSITNADIANNAAISPSKIATNENAQFITKAQLDVLASIVNDKILPSRIATSAYNRFVTQAQVDQWNSLIFKVEELYAIVGKSGSLILNSANQNTTNNLLNYTVASGSITTNELANGAVTTEKIANNSVDGSKITACGDAQILRYSVGDNKWICSEDRVGGGGGGSTTINMNVSSGSILNDHVATGSLNPDRITTNSDARFVTDAQIAYWNGITGSGGGGSGGFLAPGSITSLELADGSVTNQKLATDAITSDKILDGNIFGADISNNSITTTHIVDGAITTNQIADNAVTPNKIFTDSDHRFVTDAQITQWNLGGGSGSGGGGVPPAGSVTANELANDAVTNPKIAPDAVTSDKIMDGTITDTDITSISISKIINGVGQYFTYRPNDVPCVDGQVLLWDNTNGRWICGSVSLSGALTSESDPIWTAASVNYYTRAEVDTNTYNRTQIDTKLATDYVATGVLTANYYTTGATNTNFYTKTNMSTSGQSAVHYGNLTNIPLANNATNGILTFNDWISFNAKIGTGTSFGGDVSGTYNNLQIAAGVVGTTELANDAVTSGKILNGTIVGADIAANTIADSNIIGIAINKISSAAGQYFTYAPNGAICANGEVLKWQSLGSRWVCGTDNSGTGAESDPIWTAAMGNYYTKTDIDTNFATTGSLSTYATIAYVNANYVLATHLTSNYYTTGAINTLLSGYVTTTYLTSNYYTQTESDARYVTTGSLSVEFSNYATTGALATTNSNLATTNTNVSNLTTTVNTLSGNVDTVISSVNTVSGNLATTNSNLANKEDIIATGTTGQYYRGDKTWQNLNTDNVAEGTMQYFTTARARQSISALAPLNYNNVSGVMELAGCANGEVLKYNAGSGSWDCSTDSTGLGAESDPIWTAAMGNYYTKTDIDTNFATTGSLSTYATIAYVNANYVLATHLTSNYYTTGAINTLLSGYVTTTYLTSNYYTQTESDARYVTTGSLSVEFSNYATTGALATTNSNLATTNTNVSNLTTTVNTLSGNVDTVISSVNTVSGNLATTNSNLATTNTNVSNLTTTVNTLSGNVDTVISSVNTVSGNLATTNSNLANKEDIIATGTTGQYYRGDKTWQNLNTDNVAEGTMQYFTTARARQSISALAPLNYNNVSGVMELAGCANGEVLKYNAGSGSWDCSTDSTGLGAESDPIWTAAMGNYYTKTDIDTNFATTGSLSTYATIAYVNANYVLATHLTSNYYTTGAINTLLSGYVTTTYLTSNYYTQTESDARYVTTGSLSVEFSNYATTGALATTNSNLATTNTNVSNLTTTVNTLSGNVDTVISSVNTVSGNLATTNSNLANKEDIIATGTTGQYYRGDKTWQNLNTDNVAEGTMQYFTTARARQSISALAPLNYNNVSGVMELAGCANGEVLKYNAGSGSWDCSTDSTGLGAESDPIWTAAMGNYYTKTDIDTNFATTGSLSTYATIAYVNANYVLATHLTSNYYTTGAINTLLSGYVTTTYLTSNYYTQTESDARYVTTGSLSVEFSNYATTGALATTNSNLATTNTNVSNLTTTVNTLSGNVDTVISSVNTVSGNLATTNSNLANKEDIIATGTTGQYYRGDKTWQNLNTDNVAEGTMQYFTTARARQSISALAPLNYNNVSGVMELAGCANGEVLKYNAGSGSWDCSTDSTGLGAESDPIWTAAMGNYYTKTDIDTNFATTGSLSTYATIAYVNANYVLATHLTSNYYTTGAINTLLSGYVTTTYLTSNYYTQTESDARYVTTGSLSVEFSNYATTGALATTNSNLATTNTNVSNLTTTVNTLSGNVDTVISSVNTVSGNLATTNSNLANKEDIIATGTTGQYYRGDKTWQNLNTDNVAEGTMQYFTTARARQSISALAPLNYNNVSGVMELAGCANGEVLKYNAGSGSWDCSTDSTGLGAESDPIWTAAMGNYYTKTDIDTNFATTGSLSTYATIAYVNANYVSTAYLTGNYYTTGAINTLLANYYSTGYINTNFATTGALATTNTNVSNLTTTVNTLSGNVNTLSGNVATLTTTVNTVSGNLATLSGNVATLSGRVNTLSGSVTTLTNNLASNYYNSGYINTNFATTGSLSTYATIAYVNANYVSTAYLTGNYYTTGAINTLLANYYSTGYINTNFATTGALANLLPTGSATGNTLRWTVTGWENSNSGDLLVNGLTIGKGFSGSRTGNTALGSGALRFNGNGAVNSYEALYNTAVGEGALFSNTTGYYNTANGYQALSSNIDGYSNTANGNWALFSNTTGYSNTANGNWALYSNTTGNYNTANGYQALFSNTDGDSNTANGHRALFSNTTGYSNTANGNWALYSNTTGNSNTANGLYALSSNTTGFQNTANGVNAGRNDAVFLTGSYNSFFGFSTSYSFIGITNATALGAYAYVTASNTMVLGSVNGVNGAMADTTVVIGSGASSSGVYKLDVQRGYINSSSGYCINGNCASSWSGILSAAGGTEGPIFTATIFGENGDMPVITSATSPVSISEMHGPFAYATPSSCPAGLSRQFKLYAVYTDTISGAQSPMLRISFSGGTDRDFTLSATNGASPKYRTYLSNFFTETNTNDATMKAWVSGSSGPSFEVRRAEIWTYCR